MITKMYEREVEGVKVMTNLPTYWRDSLPMGGGSDKKGYRMIIASNLKLYGSTECEQLIGLVRAGYKTIRFEEVSTAIRGLHTTIAYVK